MMPRTWQPPKNTAVTFRIELDPMMLKDPDRIPEGMKIEHPDKMAAAVYKRLGLKWSRHGFTTIKLDDKRWPAIMEATDRLGQMPFHFRSLWLEEPPSDAADPAGWFQLSAGAGEFLGPARAGSDKHFMWSEGDFFSQRFVDCVRKHGLTGLEFLPLPERFAKAKPGPMTWYQGYATSPLGRGLDHPLLDVARHEQELGRGKEPLDMTRRWGKNVVEANEIDRDVEIEHPRVRQFLRMRPPYFRVTGPDRYCREHLPSTDFAYGCWGWSDAKRPLRPIMCNAKARSFLIDTGLLKPNRFEAVQIIAAADAKAAGVAVLDRTVRGPVPSPLFTPKEAAEERARREAALNAAKKSTSQTNTAFKTVAGAAKELAKRLAARNAPWTPLSAQEIKRIERSTLFGRTPTAWRKLLPFIPSAVEAEIDGQPFTFEVCEPEWCDWLPEPDDERPAAEKPSQKDLCIGRTPFGDWFAVRLHAKDAPADAKVTLWDHETLSVAETWPSVAAFAGFLVEACDLAAARPSESGAIE